MSNSRGLFLGFSLSLCQASQSHVCSSLLLKVTIPQTSVQASAAVTGSKASALLSEAQQMRVMGRGGAGMVCCGGTGSEWGVLLIRAERPQLFPIKGHEAEQREGGLGTREPWGQSLSSLWPWTNGFTALSLFPNLYNWIPTSWGCSEDEKRALQSSGLSVWHVGCPCQVRLNI